jgi:hypothetical protein
MCRGVGSCRVFEKALRKQLLEEGFGKGYSTLHAYTAETRWSLSKIPINDAVASN